MGIRTTVAASCLWLALMSVQGSAKIIYVDGDAPGLKNGTSWTNAYKNLQDGLAQAATGDEIWVAQGVYRPDKGTGQTAGTRSATFQLKSGVKVYGGYAGYGQPKPNSRNIQVYVTTLSGDLKGDDVQFDPNNATAVASLLADSSRQDNCYTVVTGSGADATALLSGFTITGGNANGLEWRWPYAEIRGAGLFVYLGSPTIEDCTFLGNTALHGGGAVGNQQAKPSLVRCTLTANYGKETGGAITNLASSPTVSQCTFVGNIVDGQEEGGAIYSLDSHVAITGSTFERNGRARLGGAIYNSNSDANVVGSRFVGNLAAYSGGAIDSSAGSHLTCTSCTFIQNDAWYQGGAVEIVDSDATLTNCRFHSNTAGFTGGAFNEVGARTAITNSVFTGNTASTLGGAFASSTSPVTIVNCTFAGNKAPSGAAIGPDMHASDHVQICVYNSILWDQADDEVYLGGMGALVIYCDVFDKSGSGRWTLYANEHNMSEDPRFVDPNGADGLIGTEDDNLKLAQGSPCIDAGNNGLVPSGIVVDLDGKKRFVDDPDTIDKGTGKPPIVDLGACEYVKYVPGPTKPVANAGPDQTVFAWLDNQARVTLDGSASKDADGDVLTYKWTWRIGTANYQAEGVSPLVTLPVGAITVTLVVNDGRQNSNSDKVVITVLGPFTAKTSIQPEEINRNDPRVEYLVVLMQLSEIAVSDIDDTQALIMTPGQIPAVSQPAFDRREGQTFLTTITALFEKDALMQAIKTNGGVTLTVTGKLTSGLSFSGSAPVTIVGTPTSDLTAPVPNPMEWAQADPNAGDPNDPNHWPGEPRAVLIDPRADQGSGETGWAIAMRAAKATDPKGGIEYQFDCFEDDTLDRTWSPDPDYVTGTMKRTDVVNYTFRCRAKNQAGGMTAWSKWTWIGEVPTP